MPVEMKAATGSVGRFLHRTGAVDAITTTVYEDEPCFYLGEFNVLQADSRGRRRYQMLRIVRHDALVTAYIDLGPSSAFAADQFQMIGGVLLDDGRGQADCTVAELREGAERMRGAPLYRPFAPSDLQTQWREFVDQKARYARHQSTFGPQGHLQRD